MAELLHCFAAVRLRLGAALITGVPSAVQPCETGAPDHMPAAGDLQQFIADAGDVIGAGCGGRGVAEVTLAAEPGPGRFRGFKAGREQGQERCLDSRFRHDQVNNMASTTR